MSEDEKFVRSIYPELKIVQYYGEPLGIYDVSGEATKLYKRGSLLQYIFKKNFESAWTAIKDKINRVMIEKLETDPYEKSFSIGNRKPAKKAPR